MERPTRRARAWDWLWFLAWGLASSVWCWTAARELGATFDEPVYIRRGLEGWRTGSHRGLLQLGTMPLPVDVDTLPLYLWERWHGVRLDPEHDFERLLPWARTGTLLFWGLLLTYARLAGRHLAGAWGGRLAVALLASEPILLAHASLATTDLAVTACLLALVYHYRTGREAGWLQRKAVPAFWFAASLLAKASSLVFGPICLFVVEMEYLCARPSTPSSPRFSLRPFRRDLTQIVAGGLLLTFLYCGSDWKAEPSFVDWAHRLPDGTSSRALVWVAEHLRIFSNAGEGLVRQVKHNVRGHGTYLLGRVADRSIWYYFPLSLTIKLSVPLLILPLLLAVVRPRALVNWACLAALALLALSVTYRVQIGIRLILPLIALAAVGLAAAAVQTCGAVLERVRAWERARAGSAQRCVWRVKPYAIVSSDPHKPEAQAKGTATPSLALQACDYRHTNSQTSLALTRALGLTLAHLLPLFVGAGIFWTASAALLVWPHGLCYTNELWGGTRHGYRCLSDSNYDWGQGLRELARWQQRHPDKPLDVWYFGSDPSLTSLPVREVAFHTLVLKGPEEFLALERGHYLAVGTSLLYGSLQTGLHSSAALSTYEQVSAVLRGRRPVDRTTTFLIYDFTELAEAASTTEPGSGAHESLTKAPGAPLR